MLPTSLRAEPAAPPAHSRVRTALLAHREAALFWAATITISTLALVRSAYLFHTAIHEAGDEALNSMLVVRAEHGHQLVGNYSRVGFHHPGPALVYLLAAGQAVFHGMLHVVPTPYNGQLLGSSVYAAVLLALTALAFYRATSSAAVGAIAAGAAFLFGTHHHLFADVWFPYLYMAPFLLFTVSGALLAAGRTVELPSFVLALGLLVHGHISFVATAGAGTLLALGSWAWQHRRGRRAELRAHRVAALLAAGLLALFLLPLVLEVLLHFPGPWPGYLHYLGVPHAPRTIASMVTYFGWYWSHSVPWLVLVVAGVVAVALLATSRGRPAERVFGYLYGAVAVQTVLFFGYLYRGVDYPNDINRYVGFYFLTVPLLGVITAVAHLVVRAREHDRARTPVRLLAAVTALALGVAGLLAHRPVDQYVGGTDYASAAAAVAASTPRQAVIRFRSDGHDAWPQTAGIAIAALRQQLHWCVVAAYPAFPNLFTAGHICAPHQAGTTIEVAPAGVAAPPGTTVWQDPSLRLVLVASGGRRS